jgi:hypothetical protein
MSPTEIIAMAAIAQKAAKELGLSLDLHQLARRVGWARPPAALWLAMPVIAGAGVGFAAGVLLAPRAGKETRAAFSARVRELLDAMKKANGDAASAGAPAAEVRVISEEEAEKRTGSPARSN